MEAFIDSLITVFREVWRVLRDDGVCFVNLGDSYAGSGKGPSASLNKQNPHSHLAAMASRGQRIGSVHGESGHTSGVTPPAGLKAKDLCLIPERFALAMQQDGWYVRSRIAWCKRAPMPESVTDRPTSAWEHVWLFSKRRNYYWDQEAVREVDNGKASGNGFDGRQGGAEWRPQNGGVGTPERWQPGSGRNQWNYWLLSPEPSGEQHYASFPTEIPRRAILAGTSERGVCPSCGAPWRRVVEKNGETPRMVMQSRGMASYGIAYDPTNPNAINYAGAHDLPSRQVITTGWAPSCTCDAGEPVPATVFDPFAGSGTVPLVADRLGRRGIGTDLSAEYCRMARRRLRSDAPLWNGLP